MANLADMVEQAVKGLGYELVDFETSPRARLLRVFIDRLQVTSDATDDVPETAEAKPAAKADLASAITVADCAAVSNHLSRLFSVENIDFERLEVSSPGLDRPLKRPEDFNRFAGHRVNLKLRVAQEQQRNFSGVILACDEGHVRIDSDGSEREFAFDNIEKARLSPTF